MWHFQFAVHLNRKDVLYTPSSHAYGAHIHSNNNKSASSSAASGISFEQIDDAVGCYNHNFPFTRSHSLICTVCVCGWVGAGAAAAVCVCAIIITL